MLVCLVCLVCLVRGAGRARRAELRDEQHARKRSIWSIWLGWGLRIALRGVTAFPFLSSSNGFGKVYGRGSEEEERADQ